MATINVDQVAAYALIAQNKVINVDQVSAYALVKESKNFSWLQLAKQHIANSINTQYQLALKITDFTLGTPRVNATNGYNTIVEFTALPSSGFRGSMDVMYTRFPIGEMVKNFDLSKFKHANGAQTTREMLAVFNATFGTVFDLFNIVDEPLNPTGNTLFKAAPESTYFIPGSTADMGVIAPSARNWEIPDFEWPDLVQLSTLGGDFSASASLLNAVSTTAGTITNALADTLATTANSVCGVGVFKSATAHTVSGGLRSARVQRIALPNAAYPECDQSGKYAKAVIIIPQGTSWFKKNLIFHYNG